jgi:hypothetical protein
MALARDLRVKRAVACPRTDAVCGRSKDMNVTGQPRAFPVRDSNLKGELTNRRISSVSIKDDLSNEQFFSGRRP